MYRLRVSRQNRVREKFRGKNHNPSQFQFADTLVPNGTRPLALRSVLLSPGDKEQTTEGVKVCMMDTS